MKLTFAVKCGLVPTGLSVQVNGLDLRECLHEIGQTHVELAVGQVVDAQPLTLHRRDGHVPLFAVT